MYKRQREFHHVLVFCALADRAELRMVAILFAPLGVAAGRLDVTVRARANPDVRISRRDCKLADALERGPSRIVSPFGLTNVKPLPALWRRMPGCSSETKLKRGGLGGVARIDE